VRINWLLALTFCVATHAANHGVIEFPIEFSTVRTPALSTELRIGAGVRWSHYLFEFYSFHLGYGLAFSASPSFRQGTAQVFSSGFATDLGGRSYLAYGFDGSVFSFWPYIFLGPDLQLRVTKLNAYDDMDRVFAFDLGFCGGLGIKTRMGGFEVKIDTGAGYALSGVQLKTTIMFGFGIF